MCRSVRWGLGQEPALHAEDDSTCASYTFGPPSLAHFWRLAFSACGSSDSTTVGSKTSQTGSASKVAAPAGELTDSGPPGQPKDPCMTNSPGCDDREWPTTETETETASTPAPPQDEPLSPDGDAKVAARTAQVAIETYWIDHQSYAGADARALISIDPSLADAGSFKVSSTSQNGYALSVASGSGTTFRIKRSESGAVRRRCSAPRTGECPADGAW